MYYALIVDSGMTVTAVAGFTARIFTPEDLPCVRRLVLRTAHPPEDLPCVRRLVLRTVTLPEPFREHPKQEAALKSSGTEWFVRLVFCG